MRKFLSAIVLAGAMFGCATPIGQSPQQLVFGAKTAYAVALVVAVEYRELPACGTPVVLPCHDRALLAQIQKVDNVTAIALDTAESVVRTPSVSDDAKSKAVATANTALAAFKAITANLPKKVSK